MKKDKDDRNIGFLLGKLTEQEHEELEKKFFFDEKFFEEMNFAENELIDAYASGNLSTYDQKRFENRLLLNPKQRQRVEFSKTLLRYASSQLSTAEHSGNPAAEISWYSAFLRFISNKPLLSFSFAAILLSVFLGGVLLTTNRINSGDNELAVSQNPRNENVREILPSADNSNQTVENKSQSVPSPNKSDREKTPPLNRQKTPDEIQPKVQKKESPAIFSFVLSPGLTRADGSEQRLKIPPRTDYVKMSLKIETDDYSSYQAVLETAEGNLIWSDKNLKTNKNGKVINVLIPAKLLKSADYILSIKGLSKTGIYESAADYSFSISSN